MNGLTNHAIAPKKDAPYEMRVIKKSFPICSKMKTSIFIEVHWKLPYTSHPVDLRVKIKITPSFSSVLVSRGDTEIRYRVNEIFLVALFEISTFLC